MSWAQRIDQAPTVEAKLRVLGEALDWHCANAAPIVRGHRPASKLKPMGERHLESVDTRRIFEHWLKVMDKNGNAKLTPERRRAIQARLKDGYAVEFILRAIDGCAASDFHMARGQHLGGKTFNDLTLICRNGSKLEDFEELSRGVGPSASRMAAFLGET